MSEERVNKRRRVNMKRYVFLSSVVLIFSLAAFIPVSAQWVLETVDSGGNVGHASSIALDSNVRPHISYAWFSADDADLRYAFWTGATWDIVIVDGGVQSGDHTSIALDSNDDAHISYFQGSDFSLKYAKKNGAWALQTVEASFNGPYTSIALDSIGNPRISYNYMLAGLKYAAWNGASWDIETVEGAPAYYTSLALNSSDFPRISYHDVTWGDLKYAAWNGASWDIETVDSSSTLIGQYTSLALDGSEYPHITYYDQTNGNLKYAAWNGVSWDIEIVDQSVALVGKYTSLVLDSLDYPHVSYYDETNGDLKYAVWDGASWNLEVVDGTGNVGRHTSLALDPLENAHISYYDVSNEDLKYAHYLVVIHDAGVVSIESPPDSVCTSQSNTPSVTVKNFGNVLEASIKVFCNIDAAYKDSAYALDLAPGDSTSVNFPQWTAPGIPGVSSMIVQTALPLDADPGNDRDSLSIEIWDCPGIEEETRPSSIPTRYRLSQNNPNPFNETTSITFELSAPSYVSVRIYDMTGRVVHTLTEAPAEAGVHSLAWDGKDDNAKDAPSGIYFYKLTAGRFDGAKKMTLIR